MAEDKRLKILKMLADETRFRILELLLNGEACVCEIFPKVKKTQSTVSIHLGKLERAGLIESRREGKKVFYKIKDATVCNIFRALECKKRLLEKGCYGKQGKCCK